MPSRKGMKWTFSCREGGLVRGDRGWGVITGGLGRGVSTGEGG